MLETHPTEQEVREQNARLPRGAAKFNVHPFTCPGCTRHFAPGACKLQFVYGKAHCQYCHNLTMTREEAVRGVKIDRDTLPADTPCHTCRQPIGTTRRLTVNKHGHVVHRRCPKKRATV